MSCGTRLYRRPKPVRYDVPAPPSTYRVWDRAKHTYRRLRAFDLRLLQRISKTFATPSLSGASSCCVS